METYPSFALGLANGVLESRRISKENARLAARERVNKELAAASKAKAQDMEQTQKAVKEKAQKATKEQAQKAAKEQAQKATKEQTRKATKGQATKEQAQKATKDQAQKATKEHAQKATEEAAAVRVSQRLVPQHRAGTANKAKPPVGKAPGKAAGKALDNGSTADAQDAEGSDNELRGPRRRRLTQLYK